MGQSMKVLIVDDNFSYRQSLGALLHQQFPGIKIIEAGGSEETIEKIKETVPDFLVIDIDLAGQSGLELTRKVRGELRDVKIAVITNHDLPEFRRAAKESGANYFFSKTSSDIEDLLAWVKITSLKIPIP
jgi:DNA-binding NarL/FixJ family response regulator